MLGRGNRQRQTQSAAARKAGKAPRVDLSISVQPQHGYSPVYLYTEHHERPAILVPKLPSPASFLQAQGTRFTMKNKCPHARLAVLTQVYVDLACRGLELWSSLLAMRCQGTCYLGKALPFGNVRLFGQTGVHTHGRSPLTPLSTSRAYCEVHVENSR